jgi:hypothetical protein
VSHQCGTVRFGSDPATSALDPMCKAWDHDNLYVVDAGFFASSAAVNPGADRRGAGRCGWSHLAQGGAAMSQNRPLAVVTGAGRGIGAAIAADWPPGGFDIALTDITTERRRRGAGRCRSPGARARLFPFDLADVERHPAVLDEIVAWAAGGLPRQ